MERFNAQYEEEKVVAWDESFDPDKWTIEDQITELDKRQKPAEVFKIIDGWINCWDSLQWDDYITIRTTLKWAKFVLLSEDTQAQKNVLIKKVQWKINELEPDNVKTIRNNISTLRGEVNYENVVKEWNLQWLFEYHSQVIGLENTARWLTEKYISQEEKEVSKIFYDINILKFLIRNSKSLTDEQISFPDLEQEFEETLSKLSDPTDKVALWFSYMAILEYKATWKITRTR